jgi:hypothetical protein
MRDLLSLCNEFGFLGLLSQATDFISVQLLLLAERKSSSLPI